MRHQVLGVGFVFLDAGQAQSQAVHLVLEGLLAGLALGAGVGQQGDGLGPADVRRVFEHRLRGGIDAGVKAEAGGGHLWSQRGGAGEVDRGDPGLGEERADGHGVLADRRPYQQLNAFPADQALGFGHRLGRVGGVVRHQDVHLPAEDAAGGVDFGDRHACGGEPGQAAGGGGAGHREQRAQAYALVGLRCLGSRLDGEQAQPEGREQGGYELQATPG
ncbi:hypothetical protein D9M68_660550 [compost metagenome]